MDHIHIHPSPLSLSSSASPRGRPIKADQRSWRDIVWLYDPIKEVHLTRVITTSKRVACTYLIRIAQLKISMLCLAAETQDVKLRAGFNLADTFIISRGQMRFLRLHFRHLGNGFQVPINELYEQIIKMSPAEKRRINNPCVSHSCCELWLHYFNVSAAIVSYLCASFILQFVKFGFVFRVGLRSFVAKPLKSYISLLKLTNLLVILIFFKQEHVSFWNIYLFFLAWIRQNQLFEAIAMGSG